MEKVFKHLIFPSLLSPFSSPWRLAAVVLVVPSDLLDAECRGCGLHLGGARALQRGRGRGLFHHLPTLLVVPHHGQPAGQSPKLFCPTLTVSENSKHAFCSSIHFSSVRINKHFSQCLLPFNYGPLQFFFLATISVFCLLLSTCKQIDAAKTLWSQYEASVAAPFWCYYPFITTQSENTLNGKSSLYLQMIFERHPLALLSSDSWSLKLSSKALDSVPCFTCRKISVTRPWQEKCKPQKHKQPFEYLFQYTYVFTCTWNTPQFI